MCELNVELEEQVFGTIDSRRFFSRAYFADSRLKLYTTRGALGDGGRRSNLQVRLKIAVASTSAVQFIHLHFHHHHHPHLPVLIIMIGDIHLYLFISINQKSYSFDNGDSCLTSNSMGILY